ncbi:DUF58 domain-containing protein, partial [Halorubrum sp. SS7]
RREVLELAARTGPGAVADDEADVTVVAGPDDARFRAGDRSESFADLRREAEAERATGDGAGTGRADAAPDGREVASP